MNDLQSAKYVQVIAPVAIVDNASWTTNEIDTAGWDYLTVVFNLGATDIAMAALKMQSGDVSGTVADVTGLDCDGDTDIDGDAAALPSATDDNKLIIFQIDLRVNNHRYWDLVATAGDGAAGTFGSAVAILSRGAVSAITETASGGETVLRV